MTRSLPVEKLRPEGVAVLLVYGAAIRVARDGKPGIRITAGYHDGSVLLEAVGFDPPNGGAACDAIVRAGRACLDAGLVVHRAPHRMSNFPARVIYRRPS